MLRAGGINVCAKIGLIGIGLVGTALAERLLAGGFEVVGFDVRQERCDELERLGGRAAGSPAEVAQEAARAVLSLMDTGIVRQVVQGRGGILQAGQVPRVIVDTTTGDPDEAVALAHELARRAIQFLDATISGSSQQVRDGDAVFMVGGERVAFETCQDLWHAFGDHAYYLGPSGSGSKAKLASNLILGLNRLVLAEGLVFAEKLGIELGPFLELLRASPAYSVAMDVKGQKMLEGDFSPQARLRQHRKDVALILSYAQRLGQQVPLSRVHLEILDRAIQAGDGELDNSAVIRQIRRMGKPRT
jgi:3-hydroxyisobutyrate dehydrogenase-like beta-hydroxyacid dehydrogenase